MKNKKDFTTKKGNKLFNRRKHRQKHAQGSKKVRKPYKKGGGACGCQKGSSNFPYASSMEE